MLVKHESTTTGMLKLSSGVFAPQVLRIKAQDMWLTDAFDLQIPGLPCTRLVFRSHTLPHDSPADSKPSPQTIPQLWYSQDHDIIFHTVILFSTTAATKAVSGSDSGS